MKLSPGFSLALVLSCTCLNTVAVAYQPMVQPSIGDGVREQTFAGMRSVGPYDRGSATNRGNNVAGKTQTPSGVVKDRVQAVPGPNPRVPTSKPDGEIEPNPVIQQSLQNKKDEKCQNLDKPLIYHSKNRLWEKCS